MRLYELIDANDLATVAPLGYKLAVMRLPFSRKFAITWWVDSEGTLGKRDKEAVA